MTAIGHPDGGRPGLSRHGSSRTTAIDGHMVHYHDVGTGPPLVIPQAFGPLPGTTAWLTYHRVLDELAATQRCILFDYPNFGLSEPREFHEPVHDMYVRIAFAIVDQLGLNRVRVLGVSTGGTVALGMAIAAPDRVERMVVGGCTASTGGDPYLLATAPTEVGRLFDECQSGPPDRQRIERLLRSLVYDPSLIGEELIERFYRWRVDEPRHAEAWLRSTVVKRSNLSALSSLTMPTLLVHGRHDRMVPLEASLQLLNHLPQADLLVLNDCGHWPPYERPRDFARAAREFLAQ